ncbi:amidase, partial [Achromobacter sp. KAs 3-5]
ARKPARLVALETEGWTRAEPQAREAFEATLDALSRQGVSIIRRGDSALVDALERAISQAAPLSLRLISWEQRWSLANLVANHPYTLGPSLVRQLESGRAMTLADYRECLLLREHARQCLAALATQCDALVSLNACGAAPIAADIRDTRYPTGDVSFACASSLLGAPAINVPLMAVDGLPLGLQVMGLPHGDAAITGIGTWICQSLRNPG